MSSTTATNCYWLPSLAQTGESPNGGDLDEKHHALAARWLREHESPAAPGIVLAQTVKLISQFSVYSQFQSCSPSSRSRVTRGGPVLALFPSIKSLRQAERLAQSQLCVFGGSNLCLDYWTEDRDAQLLSNFVPSQLAPLSHEQLDVLDGAVFFGGTNSFSGSHEKSNARSAIGRLRASAGAPSQEQVEAYLATKNTVGQDGVRWFVEEYGRR